eukprot:Skav217467  [mRNA]  locus=scaffold1405:114080:114376:+ [translate_table: standard]
MTPREIEMITMYKMGPVHGAFSINGTEISPQESPATICWKSVKPAAVTLAKPRGQRSHDVGNSMVEVIGLKSSTARIAQKIRTETSISEPNKIALMEE